MAVHRAGTGTVVTTSITTLQCTTTVTGTTRATATTITTTATITTQTAGGRIYPVCCFRLADPV